MIPAKYALLALGLSVALGAEDAQPQTAGGEPKPRGERPRYLVFWCNKPEDLKNATHITPQVWVEGDGAAAQKFPEFRQADWLKRGILPLRWRGGCCYKEKTEDALVAHWAGAGRMGYKGIAIDEFGCDRSGEFDRKMARALVRTRRQAPDLFIAVWQTRHMSDVLLEAYREAADLIMVEVYVGGKTRFAAKFEEAVNRARKAGILHKTILALGINDQLDKKERQRRGQWANSAAELEAQVSWIRTRAPEMPGVAFYAPHASGTLVRCADELAGRYYPKRGRSEAPPK